MIMHRRVCRPNAVLLVHQLMSIVTYVPDGLDQLIGPSEGAVVQQAATKLNQVLNFDLCHGHFQFCITFGTVYIILKSCKACSLNLID